MGIQSQMNEDALYKLGLHELSSNNQFVALNMINNCSPCLDDMNSKERILLRTDILTRIGVKS